jgi:hypothetical protein
VNISQVVVAEGEGAASGPGKLTVTMRLASAGRGLFARAKQTHATLKLTAEVSFTPPGGVATTDDDSVQIKP